MSVFSDDVADVLVLDVVPYSLRRDGRVWLGSWLAHPLLPRVVRRVPVRRHEVVECDAWALVSGDDAVEIDADGLLTIEAATDAA